jgi:hypothetical protein
MTYISDFMFNPLLMKAAVPLLPFPDNSESCSFVRETVVGFEYKALNCQVITVNVQSALHKGTYS